jgi:hypothetical protein
MKRNLDVKNGENVGYLRAPTVKAMKNIAQAKKKTCRLILAERKKSLKVVKPHQQA